MSLRLSFNLRPLGLCARCRNNLVRLRVRLCLEVEGELRSRNREARRRTFCACALMRATARAPSSCLILLLFSRSTFCGSYEFRLGGTRGEADLQQPRPVPGELLS